MKTYLFTNLSLFLLAALVVTTGCQKDKNTEPIPEPHSTLYVKFVISIRQMGAVQTTRSELSNSDNTWSENLLTGGKKLNPGEHTFFTLSIPNLHYAEYRLGVDPGDGTEILLHEQPNYVEYYAPITHWGGDDRTVSTTVWKQETTGNYYISGWSDFAGISK